MSILKIYGGGVLQAALATLVKPVQVTYLALDQPEPDTIQVLTDLKKLTPNLAVSVQYKPLNEADRVIVAGENGRQLVFVGPPLGTELAALVSAVIVAGRTDSGLLAVTQQALTRLRSPVHLQIFTTPT